MRAAIDPLVIPPILYNLVALLGSHRLLMPIFSFKLASGWTWALSVGDILLMTVLTGLALSMCQRRPNAKSKRLRRWILLAVLLLCAFEFVFLSGFGTSVFFLMIFSLLIALFSDRMRARSWAAPGKA